MAPVTIRPATLTDVVAMARLRDASEWTGGAPEATMRRYLAGEHHPQRALAPRAAFVAESGDASSAELAGYVAGHLTERFGCDGELQWLLVHPRHRGGDVADRLVRALALWFASHGATRVCVNVDPGNERARRLYRRLGATELAPHWMEWADISTATAAPRV